MTVDHQLGSVGWRGFAVQCLGWFYASSIAHCRVFYLLSLVFSFRLVVQFKFVVHAIKLHCRFSGLVSSLALSSLREKAKLEND